MAILQMHCVILMPVIWIDRFLTACRFNSRPRSDFFCRSVGMVVIKTSHFIMLLSIKNVGPLHACHP